MGDVFARSRARGTARLVLLALADVAHDTGEVSAYRRSHRVLAAKANVAERSVVRAIAELVELGELVVVERGDGRRQSDYQIVVPADRGVTDCHPSDGGSRGDRLSPLGCQVVTPIITSLSIPDVSTPPPAARGRADRPKPSPEARAVARAVWGSPVTETRDAVRGVSADRGSAPRSRMVGRCDHGSGDRRADAVDQGDRSAVGTR